MPALGARLLADFAAERDVLIDELSTLVRFDTPSGRRAEVARLAEHYAKRLDEFGFGVELVDGPNGPHVFAEREGRQPAIVLCAHSDTVWPIGEPGRRPPTIRGERLSGPGIYDMRAGLALILWALRHAVRAVDRGLAQLDRKIIVFISADEELGSPTARPAMDARLPRNAIALVPEPPCRDGAIKVRRKGVSIYGLEAIGREAHAGVEPERGASAISAICRLVLEAESLRDPARGITVNVGTIEGGTATNVIAGRARAGIDLRFDRLEDGLELDERMRALASHDAGVVLSLSGGIAFPPLVPTTRSLALAERFSAIARDEFGETIGLGCSGGGSDGSYLASRGLTVVDGLGIDGGGAHARDEYVLVDRIPFRAALFTRFLLALAADDPAQSGLPGASASP
jgi:glutamate carboxypeptidase